MTDPRTNLTVGPITARAGEMKSGTIDLGFTSIPITVVNGARPGPVLALVAGNHGYEYPPILALQRLLPTLKPKKLAGAVILVHVANMPSFLGRTVYFSPLDQKNLNRMYPGKAEGTPSERIAFAITHQVIDRCDVLLDLHCGDGNESLRPYVYQTITGEPSLDARIAELVDHCGFDHIIMDRGRPADPSASLYCSNTAITRGKPAVTIESGFLGGTDERSVKAIVDCCENAMRYLGIASGRAKPVKKPRRFEKHQVLESPATGILETLVERDQKVRKGQPMVRITDFFGKRIAEVKAPFSGVVLYVVATPPIVKGQPVGFVASD